MRRLILDSCKLLTEAFSLSLVIDNLGRKTNPKRKMLVQFAGAARFLGNRRTANNPRELIEDEMQFGGYLNSTCLSLARFTLCDAQFSGTVLAGSPVSISHMESGQKLCVLPFPAVCLFQTSSYNE